MMADIEQISSDDRNLAVVTHLGGTIFSIFPALIVWLLKKDSNPFVEEQALEALNFQITVLMAYFISYILIFILVGIALVGLVWLLNIVFCVIAAIAASKGEHYRYPFTLRLLS